jgi:hypothetical protein
MLEVARSQWANGAFSGSVTLVADAVREAAMGALSWRGADPSDSLLETFRTELINTGLVEHDHHAFWEDLETDRRKIEEELYRFTAASSKERLEKAEAFVRRLDRFVSTGPRGAR